MLPLKIYFKGSEHPRTRSSAANDMRCRVCQGAMHGNRKMRFPPSGLVLLDLSLQPRRDADRSSQKLGYVCVGRHPHNSLISRRVALCLSRSVDNNSASDADKQACQQQSEEHGLAMRVRYFFGVTTERANACSLFGVLEGSFQNLVNRSVDLFFRRIEFDAATVAIHELSS